MLEKLAAAMKNLGKTKGKKTPAVKAVEARVSAISKKAAAKGSSDSKVIKKAQAKAATMAKEGGSSVAQNQQLDQGE